ncbi:unnamed protein product [Camellia sinensis]
MLLQFLRKWQNLWRKKRGLIRIILTWFYFLYFFRNTESGSSPIGPLCWKVWVNHVTINVPLFRSTHEMYDLQDAIGSTVAWPSQFILLTKY